MARQSSVNNIAFARRFLQIGAACHIIDDYTQCNVAAQVETLRHYINNRSIQLLEIIAETRPLMMIMYPN